MKLVANLVPDSTPRSESVQNRKRWYVRTVVGAVALLGVAAATVPLAASAAERFVMGLTASPLTFHPWDMGQFNSPNHANFYNRLVQLNKQLEPEPDLATNWEFSDGGKVFTMKLRQGVKFHNGKELTSEDVRRSWLQITKGKFVGSHANLKPLAKLVKDVETPDPYTVRLVYTSPNPAVFDFLDLFYIVDMDQWDKHSEMPIGTGPYRMKEYVPGDRLVFETNQDYFGPKPQIGELVFRVIPDPQSLVLNLESGTVDGIIFFPGREVKRLREKGFEVFAANPDGIVFDVLFGVQHDELKDKRVRQAINMMINRNRFHRIIMAGNGAVRCLPWPEASLAYDAELNKTCEFNPEKAKALLAEAGYPNGFEIELLTSTQMSSDWVKLAEMLQNDLKRIGITAKVVDKDKAGWQAVYRGKSYQLSTHNFGRGNKDPASLYGTATVWKAEGNTQNYSNEEYGRLIKAAASTLDVEERKRIYRQLNEIVLDEVFIAAIHTNPRWFAHKKEFKNIGASVDGFMYFAPMTR